MRSPKTILALVLLLIITGCETERILFKGPYFVRFTDTTLTKKESYSQPLNLEIHIAGPVLDQDVEIAYQISGDAREGIDYTILGERERVTIKKGQYFANIQVQLINNSNNILRSQQAIFTLQTVSTNKLQIGQGESAIGKTFTLTIEDDCILGGTYSGTYGPSTLDGISITSSDCANYTLSNWNINVFAVTTTMDLKFVDNGDNTLTIPTQDVSALPSDLATINGTGVVDPVTRVIIFNITLVDFTGQPEVNLTYTPE